MDTEIFLQRLIGDILQNFPLDQILRGGRKVDIKAEKEKIMEAFRRGELPMNQAKEKIEALESIADVETAFVPEPEIGITEVQITAKTTSPSDTEKLIAQAEEIREKLPWANIRVFIRSHLRQKE